MLSYKKKKMSLSPRSQAIKRENVDEEMHRKRIKAESEKLLKDSNFIRACEKVKKELPQDMLNDFQLLHFPSCLSNCNHEKKMKKIKEMPPHAEETFHIEMHSNKWFEALEVSFLSITPTQYLSANVLKNIVEIMLNAHDDPLYNMTHLIDKCQQTLSLNLKMHPPCSLPLWQCYNNFLTSPMDLRKKTLTNRVQYGSEDGIFRYCINRLENELSTDSNDGPFFDKEKEIPQHIDKKIREMHWIKSRLEIYEMLNRTDRIDRLMAVMDSMNELLLIDLAIWQSRRQCTGSRGSNRHQNLLLMKILAPTTPKNAINAINDTCMQIMTILVKFVHLNYPEKFIKTLSLCINILSETLHLIGQPDFDDICDFYKPGKTCTIFASNFYEIIADLPPESILKILARITPARQKYSIGILLARKLLSDSIEGNIIKLLINFINKCQWNDFPEATTALKVERIEMPKSITSDNILKRLTMICKNHNKSCENNNNVVYLKFKNDDGDYVKDRNYVMKILLITFQAYLDTFYVHRFQKTLLQLNNESNVNQLEDSKDQAINKNSKSIRKFIIMYKEIYIDLKEYFSVIKRLKSKNELPEIFDIFENIIDLNEL